jgi:hypothetical protein
MSECLQEGAWRAYLDGELPPEEMALAAGHLEQCAACAALHRDLAGPAARIGILMADLADVPAPGLLKALRVAPSRPRWIWAAAGLAAAAALAAAFALAPRRPAPDIRARASVIEAPPPVAEPIRPIVPAAAVGGIPRARPARRQAQPRPQYFLALDEEPIDTGTVMRVSLASGIEADVIVDSEGRPRAIRPVR